MPGMRSCTVFQKSHMPPFISHCSRVKYGPNDSDWVTPVARQYENTKMGN